MQTSTFLIEGIIFYKVKSHGEIQMEAVKRAVQLPRKERNRNFARERERDRVANWRQVRE